MRYLLVNKFEEEGREEEGKVKTNKSRKKVFVMAKGKGEVGDCHIYQIPNLSVIWIEHYQFVQKTQKNTASYGKSHGKLSLQLTASASEELSCFETLGGGDKRLGHF